MYYLTASGMQIPIDTWIWVHVWFWKVGMAHESNQNYIVIHELNDVIKSKPDPIIRQSAR